MTNHDGARRRDAAEWLRIVTERGASRLEGRFPCALVKGNGKTHLRAWNVGPMTGQGTLNRLKQ